MTPTIQRRRDAGAQRRMSRAPRAATAADGAAGTPTSGGNVTADRLRRRAGYRAAGYPSWLRATVLVARYHIGSFATSYFPYKVFLMLNICGERRCIQTTCPANIS